MTEHELIERMARVIDPDAWRVMDNYLAETQRKYHGQNVSWPDDQFKHKQSLERARFALSALREAIPGLDALIAGTGVVVPKESMFPIMHGPAVPWSLIAPYEAQARKNHGQTLKRLAERGGLSISEAMAIMSEAAFKDRPIEKPTVEDWLDFIAARKQREAHRAMIEAAKGE